MRFVLIFTIYLLQAASLTAQSNSFPDIYKKRTLKNQYGAAQKFVDSIFLRMNAVKKKTGVSLSIYKNPSAYKSSYFSAANIKYYYEMIGRGYLSVSDDTKHLRAVDSFAQNIRYADIQTAMARGAAGEGLFEKSGSFIVIKSYYDSLATEFCGKVSYFGKPVLYNQVDQTINFCRHLKDLILLNNKQAGVKRKDD